MKEALLGEMRLLVRQDGALIMQGEFSDKKEVVSVLDSGKEPYENAHSIATAIDLFKGGFEQINDSIREFNR